ncbi:MAG: iron-only hydrogenase system regulator [Clostridia bacterium]|nr:iron-only hydrogenase system regulator [Clostridia bacterium]MBP5272840.1 iron-only hydrogenase system regulator [Clostridia bacterium]MBP5460300.1 iron-only hydrogenase system regulator [Clostridia bacterium]
MCDTNKRMGFIGILVEDLSAADAVNEALSQHGKLIVGRMGIPYRDRGVSVISLVVDGTNDEVSALTGTLGRIPGISVKSMLEKVKK